MMKTNTAVLWVLMALIAGGAAGYYASPRSVAEAAGEARGAVPLRRQLALYSSMRKLWADHVFWARAHITAMVNGAPGADQAAARLAANEEDIADAITSYYGGEAGKDFAALLRKQGSITMEIISLTKARDAVRLQGANKRGEKNARAIAALLADLNPQWAQSHLESLTVAHMELTAAEIAARFGKKYQEDIVAFDEVFTHAMKLADALSSGIIGQFPLKFE